MCAEIASIIDKKRIFCMGKVLRKSAPQDIIKKVYSPVSGQEERPWKSETHTRQPEKMVETFGMEILHRGSDYDSAVITIPT